MNALVRCRGIYLPKAVLLFAVLTLSCGCAYAQIEKTDASPKPEEKAQKRIVAKLELGKPLERELGGGGSETFTVKVKQGRFLRVVAQQKGIDVAIILTDPGGKALVEAHSPNDRWGPQPASLIAATSGNYQVQVQNLGSNTPTGKYSIEVTDLRKPRAEDEQRIAAETALFAAGKQTGADSAEKTAELYEKARKLWHGVHDDYEEALCLYVIGGLRARAGGIENSKRAIEYFTQAASLFHTAQDSRREAMGFNEAGGIFQYLGEKQKALECFTQALPLIRAAGDRDEEAEVLTNIGSVHDELGEKQKALELYEQALPLFRTTGDRSSEATVLNNIGRVYLNSGEEQKALEYFNQALPLERAVGDHRVEGITLNNIGSAYNNLGDEQKALEYYSQTLLLMRAVGDHRSEAIVLNNIGGIYHNLGEEKKAIDYLGQALALERAEGDRGGEAASLNNIGKAYSHLGEHQKALEYFNQALPLERAVGDRYGEASALSNIGTAFDYLGDKQKALDNYIQALALEHAVGDRFGEAATLSNIGYAYDDLGEKQKALNYYNQALPLQRAVGDRPGEGKTLNSIGYAYDELGEKQKALDYYSQALQITRAVGDRPGEAATLNNIGNVYTSLGERQKALEHLDEALALSRALEDPVDEGNALQSLMVLWTREKNPLLAIFFGKQSVNAFQQVRRNIQGLDKGLQRSFLKSKEEVYRELGDLLITQGRLAEAQQVLDLLKEQEYIDFIRGNELSVEAKSKPISLNPEEQSSHEAYEKIAGQLTAIGREYSDLRAKRTRSAEEETRLSELKEKLTAANQEMSRFFNSLYAEFGKNAQANQLASDIREQTSGMQTLVRELGAGTVALYTLVGETRYRVIVITGSTMQAREYPIGAADLRRKVAAFLDTLKNPASDPLPASQEMYKILFAPIAGDLQGARAQTLMWSLNDVLRYVPMAALHDGTRYLAENYRNVVITPASIGRLKDKSEAGNSAVAGMGVSKDYDGLGALPAVPNELKSIVRGDAGENSDGVLPGTMLLDDDFTETHMVSALDKHYPVVHIASHFVLQAGNDTNSYLLLGGKEVGGKGYHLTLAELRDDPGITFDGTELLTLSACQTGASGTALNGREVDGLGFTAQQKGAKAVLASLWSVADESTALFMADFYKQWLKNPGVTKIDALRQAQLDMLHGAQGAGERAATKPGKTKDSTDKKPAPTYSHPFYWAPFILIGNWK